MAKNVNKKTNALGMGLETFISSDDLLKKPSVEEKATKEGSVEGTNETKEAEIVPEQPEPVVEEITPEEGLMEGTNETKETEVVPEQPEPTAEEKTSEERSEETVAVEHSKPTAGVKKGKKRKSSQGSDFKDFKIDKVVINPMGKKEKKNVTLYFTLENAQRLTELAKKNGVSKSVLLNDILDQIFKDLE